MCGAVCFLGWHSRRCGRCRVTAIGFDEHLCADEVFWTDGQPHELRRARHCLGHAGRCFGGGGGEHRDRVGSARTRFQNFTGALPKRSLVVCCAPSHQAGCGGCAHHLRCVFTAFEFAGFGRKTLFPSRLDHHHGVGGVLVDCFHDCGGAVFLVAPITRRRSASSDASHSSSLCPLARCHLAASPLVIRRLTGVLGHGCWNLWLHRQNLHAHDG